MQPFTIEEIDGQTPDGMGGLIDDWKLFKSVDGYIDLLTGTDKNPVHNASVEDSTHILIIPDFIMGITDKMRVVDDRKRRYSITYSDDPVGLNHHNEIYLKFEGEAIV